MHYRGAFILLSIWLLIGLAFGQGQQTTVSYTTVAVPLASALADLSKQASETLLSSDELAKEPIVLRLTNVPKQDALAKIADVMSAEWVKTDQGLELRRTDRIVQAIRENQSRQRLESIKEALQRLQGVVAQPALDSSAAHEIALTYAKIVADEQAGSSTGNPILLRQPLDDHTADKRLAAKMLLALGAEKLAALPVGSHVFSFNPTPAQEQIEGIDAGVLSEYVSERNLLAAELDRTLPKNAEAMVASPIDFARTQAQGPVTALLKIWVQPNVRTLGAELVTYNKDGTRISWSDVGLVGEEYAASLARRSKTIAGGKSLAAITVTPVTAEFALRSVHSAKAPPPLSDQALESLCHPDRQDPFAFAFSEGLLGVASQRNKNLVATTEDFSMTGFLRSVHNGKMDLAQFLSWVGSPDRAELTESDGWMLCKPADPLAATALRTDRQSLGVFVRALNDKGFASIEDWAAMAQGVPYPAFGYLISNYMAIWRGDPWSTSFNDLDTLRFYGSLSNEQLDILRRGVSLDFASLSGEQQEILSRMLYGFNPPQLAKASETSKVGVPTDNMYGILSEPTEVAPNGIATHGLLSMKEETKDQFFVTYDGVDLVRDAPSDLQTFAYQVADIGRAMPAVDGEQATISSVRYGDQRTITFAMEISDGFVMQPSLSESHVGKKSIPIDQLAAGLPPDVWDRLSKLIDKAKAGYKKYRMTAPTPQPQAPPPPPASTR